jgi:hypothetical protein
MYNIRNKARNMEVNVIKEHQNILEIDNSDQFSSFKKVIIWIKSSQI